MQFKDLKQNYPIYILNRQDVSLTQGKVTAVGFPYYNNSNPSQSLNTNPQSQRVVDVHVEANGNSAVYTIPETSSITFAGNLVLATTLGDLINEVESIKRMAENHITETPIQEERKEKATALLSELNPAFKEKKEIDERFGKLENSISDLKNMMTTFMQGLNKK